MPPPPSPTASALGRIGLPEPVSALAGRRWDAIVVGAGHNGLTCAAYLARAGLRVLVLEALPRVGGACTLDEPWPGVRVSPCAYVCGLLHPLVIEELDLVRRGFHWTPAAGGMFVPFEDGTGIQLWNDDQACEAEVLRFAPRDLAGWKAMVDVRARLRDALRPPGDRDIWIGPCPSREVIEERLGADDEARHLLFDWSMCDYVERYLTDERLQMAYLGQGVIGTNASPADPGTASVYYHHGSGRMFGMPGTWGYVTGGMGTISFLLCDAAREAGAVVATSVPVARIDPGSGVELSSGERIHAATIICNADPRVALRLLGENADGQWRRQVESVPIESVTVKVNLLLSELPNFRARPGTRCPHHTGQINTPLTKGEWIDTHALARRGEMPDRVWTELYMQSVYDHSIAPPDRHTLTVFSQYVPHRFARGTWDTRRDEVADIVVASLARFTSNLPEAIVGRQVLGPPDVERAVGLTGGHIFQGEILPRFMWDRRLTARTPMSGFFLCGAATYPGGSVMGINGRNAAFEALRTASGSDRA
jgi:phytoene dehydrogenase-like protein